MTCPTAEELIALLVSPREQSPARGHVDAGCRDCARRLESARSMLAALEAGPFPEVRDEVRAEVLRIPAGSRLSKARSHLAALVARLVTDARTAEPALALRGGLLAADHRLFEAGGVLIDLVRLQSGALVGQVLPPPGWPGSLDSTVCMLIGAGGVHTAALDPSGDFHLGHPGPGEALLVIDGPDLHVLVPGAALGGAPAGESAS